MQALESELEMLLPRISSERKVSQIHYGGGSPTILPTQRLKMINDLILSHFQTIENPEIAIECHPGYLDLKYWDELADAGFTRVSIGVQDFNPEVLKGVRRRASQEEMSEIFRVLRNRGLIINLDLIYGLPLQSIESFRDSVQKAIDLSPDRIVTFSYAHVPWVNPNMLKLEKLGLPEAEYKQKLFTTAEDLLMTSGYNRLGLDHFVKSDDELFKAYEEKILHRNFQGYCTRRTTGEVYAVGVSGISQLKGAYAQNCKDVKEYIESINSGQFPITKGYKLAQQQQIVRELIGMLMCNNAVIWSELATICNQSIEKVQQAVGYSIDMLKEFQKDGLIRVDNQGIYITEQGAPFMRNVASKFDPLLTPGSKSYSKPI